MSASAPWLPVIVSPLAGAGNRAAVESLVLASLPSASPRFIRPDSLHDLRGRVRDLLRQGVSAIAVSGGDGTLHHVVNALGDAQVTLAPIPTGSGNDFCRGIGLTSDPAAALRALMSGRTRQVDLLEVNGQRICTVAGLGLVADTGVQASRLLAPGSPWRPVARRLGQWVYLATAAGRLLLVPRLDRHAALAWDGGSAGTLERPIAIYGVFLANLPTLGAGLRLPVPGRLDDGQFELGWLPVRSRLTLVRSLACLRGNRPVPPGALEVMSSRQAVVECPGGSALLADGEDLGAVSRVTARALPGALRVPAPPD